MGGNRGPSSRIARSRKRVRSRCAIDPGRTGGRQDQEEERGGNAVRTYSSTERRQVSTLSRANRVLELIHPRLVVAIMLARLRMSHSAVREAILKLDDNRLTVDNLKAIKHYCPTPDEVSHSASHALWLFVADRGQPPQIEALRSFEGDVATLTSADQFFNEVSSDSSISSTELRRSRRLFFFS